MECVRNAHHVHQLRQWQPLDAVDDRRTARGAVDQSQPQQLNGGGGAVRQQRQTRAQHVRGAGEQRGRNVRAAGRQPATQSTVEGLIKVIVDMHSIKKNTT